MTTKRIRTRGRIATLTIVGLALAGMSWITVSYLRLARQQVELVMAGGRVEAASRARVGLVVNLLHSAEAFSCLEEARRAGLALAASRAGRAGVTGSATVDPESYGDFLTAQQSLSGALEGVWPAVVASGVSASCTGGICEKFITGLHNLNFHCGFFATCSGVHIAGSRQITRRSQPATVSLNL